MNGFAHRVRRRIDDPSCLVDVIKKGSCDASLADAPLPHVIIDLDATGSPLGPAQAKCDFLFFADSNLVAPIEIKDGAPAIKRVKKQLQAGADAADELAPRDLVIDFRPVLVSKELRRDNQFELRQASVRLRKREEKIRRVACGAPLTEAFGSP